MAGRDGTIKLYFPTGRSGHSGPFLPVVTLAVQFLRAIPRSILGCEPSCLNDSNKLQRQQQQLADVGTRTSSKQYVYVLFAAEAGQRGSAGCTFWFLYFLNRSRP